MCLGVPGRVLSIIQRDGLLMGQLDFGGISREVCLDYVPELQVGDYAIVHVGFAITRLDQDSARQTLEWLQQLGELEQSL
ncbi:MAG: HypC/HybG/HupF family hydrogenase formation chaperone [Vulcanimicrobiota bacterium]